MKITTIKTQSPLKVSIQHTLITQEPRSDKLLVILPGRGYLPSHPVLHYLSRLAVQQGYDVFSVQYGFQAAQGPLDDDARAALLGDIAGALDALPDRDSYQRVCIAGKSLGTLFAPTAANRFVKASKSLLLLTPVLGVAEQVAGMQTLAIIGTADRAYSPDMVKPDDDSGALTWQVLDGLNHSLEVPDDWQQSLDALRKVLVLCDNFLKRE